MAGDSRQGAVYRIDTETGISSIAFSNEALAAPANVTVPIGTNGLKIFHGSLYFTNTARNTYGRVPISDEGYQTEDVEVLAELDASLGDWEDFILDGNGVAYATQPQNAVERTLQSGEHAAFVNSSIVVAPTGLTMTGDGKTYVTTRGGAVDGFTYSRRVVEITLWIFFFFFFFGM